MVDIEVAAAKAALALRDDAKALRHVERLVFLDQWFCDFWLAKDSYSNEFHDGVFVYPQDGFDSSAKNLFESIDESECQAAVAALVASPVTCEAYVKYIKRARLEQLAEAVCQGKRPTAEQIHEITRELQTTAVAQSWRNEDSMVVAPMDVLEAFFGWKGEFPLDDWGHGNRAVFSLDTQDDGSWLKLASLVGLTLSHLVVVPPSGLFRAERWCYDPHDGVREVRSPTEFADVARAFAQKPYAHLAGKLFDPVVDRDVAVAVFDALGNAYENEASHVQEFLLGLQERDENALQEMVRMLGESGLASLPSGLRAWIDLEIAGVRFE